MQKLRAQRVPLPPLLPQMLEEQWKLMEGEVQEVEEVGRAEQ